MCLLGFKPLIGRLHTLSCVFVVHSIRAGNKMVDIRAVHEEA